jgi:glycosyltransferase involved in cell wall biosynthesis
MTSAAQRGAAAPQRLRALYICYLSLSDPLVHTQVVAYLAGLAANGHAIRLLTYEPRMTRARRRALRADLRSKGIAWHHLRYHKRPSLPATIFDALAGAVLGAGIVLRHRLDAVHCRSHVPAATGLLIARVTGRRLIFDIRGLMAEEYEDAGRWERDGAPFRITKWIERAAIRRATGIVVLTERVRAMLFGDDDGGGGDSRVYVIPCCADLEAIEAGAPLRAAVRERLGAGEDPVLIYVGKFSGWYMEKEMAEFFAVAGAQRPGLRFVVLTQGAREPIEAELARHAIAPGRTTITSAPPQDVPGYLAAADLALCLIRPSPSKASSSPTKIGEYLAAGLPVVATAGVGDCDALLDGDGLGVLLSVPVERPALEAAARRALALVGDDSAARACREVARRELSLTRRGIPAYDALYRQVAAARAR